MDIAYNIIGKGEPIIFIHGIGSRKSSWHGVIEVLKDEYQCIFYDLRGHGDSTIDETNFKIEKLVEDLNKLRLHLHIKKSHIVGHSLGGMIGPYYAKKYPNSVLSLSLLSTAAFRNIDDQMKILKIITEIENRGIDTVLPSLINRWFTDDFIKKNKKIIDKRTKQIQQTPLRTFLNVFRLYALTEMGPWLKNIKIPSLIMTGENDLGCNPFINKKMADAFPNSQLIILNNLKHNITLESPYLVGFNIKKFLYAQKNSTLFFKK